jgi:hypothetical protein
VDEVRSYQAEGVKTVEMETAALLAVGKVRGVQAAAICVVGDSLAKMTWDLPEDFGPVERALGAAYAAAIEGSGIAEYAERRSRKPRRGPLHALCLPRLQVSVGAEVSHVGPLSAGRDGVSACGRDLGPARSRA